jgi:hypothetical protein
MRRNLEDIFNECLERVIAGESPESCLKDYPEWAAELRDMLGVSGQVMRAAQSIEANPEFRARLKRQVLQATPARAVPRTGWWRVPVWATSLASAFIVLAGTGGAVLAAAGGSQPDQALYPVKLGFEQVQLALVPAPENDNLRLQLAETRALEIAYLAGKGESGLIESVAKNMETALTGQPANGATLAAPAVSPRAVAPAPQAAPAPAPMAAPLAPPPAVVPQPDNRSGSASTASPPQAAPGKSTASAAKSTSSQDQGSGTLGNVVASQMRTIQILEEALRKAGTEDKPVIEKALERAKKAYEQALERSRSEEAKKVKEDHR